MYSSTYIKDGTVACRHAKSRHRTPRKQALQLLAFLLSMSMKTDFKNMLDFSNVKPEQNLSN